VNTQVWLPIILVVLADCYLRCDYSQSWEKWYLCSTYCVHLLFILG